jgi:hypothetical protein
LLITIHSSLKVAVVMAAMVAMVGPVVLVITAVLVVGEVPVAVARRVLLAELLQVPQMRVA